MRYMIVVLVLALACSAWADENRLYHVEGYTYVPTPADLAGSPLESDPYTVNYKDVVRNMQPGVLLYRFRFTKDEPFTFVLPVTLFSDTWVISDTSVIGFFSEGRTPFYHDYHKKPGAPLVPWPIPNRLLRIREALLAAHKS